MKEFGFSKEEKLKKKKDFELVYSAGKRVFSRKGKLKAVYVLKNDADAGVKVAVAVHRRAGKAFWRNRLKRLLRESYRLNKKILLPYCKEKQIHLLIVFSLNSINYKANPKIGLDEISPYVVDIMNKIKKSI